MVNIAETIAGTSASSAKVSTTGQQPSQQPAQLRRVLGLPSLVLFGLVYMVPLTVFTTYGIVTQVSGGRLPLWEAGRLVHVERSTGEHLFRGLAALGHDVNWQNNPLAFGRGQIIWRDDAGVFCGGCEPRTDGAVAGY